VLVTAAVDFVGRGATRLPEEVSGILESDFPVPEGGEDLLGRQPIVDGLVSTILLEQPAVIAVTGGYGEGKTSLLNLTVGELKKLDATEVPIVVRHSPWLAADSNSLVLSLLNSIVAEIKAKFIVPGLGRDAARYARTLLSIVPKADRLKDLVSEPSQETRIAALTDRIARTRRSVLVILDDLDRMESGELEAVFKFLRGSDQLSNITFLCSLDKTEVALILKATRPYQDTDKFVEKFFSIQFPLPKVDSSELRDLLSRKIARVITRYAPQPEEGFAKALESIWEGGAGLYFGNLRRIKLFLNKISNSLERIAGEVNAEDFIRLELIRDIAPDLYERIYRQPEYFRNRRFAFEAGFKGPDPLDNKKAETERSEFYGKLVASVPEDKRYVFQLVEDLFPHFARYRKKHITKALDATDAETGKRICHPRCFRQYFLLKVPSELMSQREFTGFATSIRGSKEERVVKTFSEKFQSLVKEEFKRWHFMHLVENSFNTFDLEVKRGLCRGMAQNSSHWTTNAFEFMIANWTSRETLTSISNSTERSRFLSRIVQESSSDYYLLTLLWQWEEKEKESSGNLLPSILEVRPALKRRLRQRYLGPNAPSVYEELVGINPGFDLVAPNQFLFAWRRLGPDAEADQRQYIKGLFARRASDLDAFLRSLFRVEFMDDYTVLKPLIDYGELAQLITLYEDKLDKEKVRQFRERYAAENPPQQKTEEDPGPTES
jgi:KAP-like P-loop domain-containing protein